MYNMVLTITLYCVDLIYPSSLLEQSRHQQIAVFQERAVRRRRLAEFARRSLPAAVENGVWNRRAVMRARGHQGGVIG